MDVAGWTVDLMERLGEPGAGLAIALENLFPPLPSEVILPVAGFAASRGDISLAGAIVWTTLGSLVGAMLLYLLGAVVGRDRIRAVAARLPLVKPADLDRAEQWFERHGAKAVLLGRLVPIVRSLISVPAGAERMPPVWFAGLTAAGSLLWNAILIGAGYQLGERWHLVETYVGMVQKLVILMAVAAAVWFLVAKLRPVAR